MHVVPVKYSRGILRRCFGIAVSDSEKIIYGCGEDAYDASSLGGVKPLRHDALTLLEGEDSIFYLVRFWDSGLFTSGRGLAAFAKVGRVVSWSVSFPERYRPVGGPVLPASFSKPWAMVLFGDVLEEDLLVSPTTHRPLAIAEVWHWCGECVSHLGKQYVTVRPESVEKCLRREAYFTIVQSLHAG